MINCAVLMGRLTNDPELRTTGNGISVTSFCVAVDRSYVKPGEDRQADFINVVAWRQTADFICKYFTKGSMIAIEGELQSRKYEDKNGNKRVAIEVVITKASFCGEKKNDNTSSASAPAEDFTELPVTEDGLPF